MRREIWAQGQAALPMIISSCVVCTWMLAASVNFLLPCYREISRRVLVPSRGDLKPIAKFAQHRPLQPAINKTPANRRHREYGLGSGQPVLKTAFNRRKVAPILPGTPEQGWQAQFRQHQARA